MTEAMFDTLKPGDLLKDVLGDIRIVDRIECSMVILKWVREDGTISPGEEWCVPSHLKDCEIFKRA